MVLCATNASIVRFLALLGMTMEQAIDNEF